MAKFDKWERLKQWVGERHDYFERQYKKTNFFADAAELGSYRTVFQAMMDLDIQEQRDLQAKKRPATGGNAPAGRG